MSGRLLFISRSFLQNRKGGGQSVRHVYTKLKSSFPLNKTLNCTARRKAKAQRCRAQRDKRTLRRNHSLSHGERKRERRGGEERRGGVLSMDCKQISYEMERRQEMQTVVFFHAVLLCKCREDGMMRLQRSQNKHQKRKYTSLSPRGRARTQLPRERHASHTRLWVFYPSVFNSASTKCHRVKTCLCACFPRRTVMFSDFVHDDDELQQLLNFPPSS